jgi:REP element-mobilizing transposase RayT
MARKLRVKYPDAIIHVMNRGDRREPIFKDEVDRQRFVEILTKACAKAGWQIHAYILMPNHFHLVVETPQPNLVAGMKWFLGTYTSLRVVVTVSRRLRQMAPLADWAPWLTLR